MTEEEARIIAACIKWATHVNRDAGCVGAPPQAQAQPIQGAFGGWQMPASSSSAQHASTAPPAPSEDDEIAAILQRSDAFKARLYKMLYADGQRIR